MEINPRLLCNLDVADMNYYNGDFELFKNVNKLDYETYIILALPFDQKNLKEGTFKVDDKRGNIEVKISKITSEDRDPILSTVKNTRGIGNFGPEIHLPPEMYTDNRGKYPYYCAIIHFPFCLAEWSDQNARTGIKYRDDDDRTQITGGYKYEDKIEALIILNKLFSSENIGLKKPLVYEDTTLFIESYFSKKFSRIILDKVTIFASNNAYKNAIEYFFGSCGEGHICEIIRKRSIPDIQTENDLLDYILHVIKDNIVHEVENRRWIDPFWNSERRIKGENKKYVTIRAEPKSESEIQTTLNVLFRLVLNDLNIQVDREPDLGIGKIDFKFTFVTKSGEILNTLIELKLAHHKKIEKGLTAQLPAYLKANKSTCGIFFIMWFKDEKGTSFKEPANRTKIQMLEFIEETSKKVSERDGINIKAVLIDASIKPSASNL